MQVRNVTKFHVRALNVLKCLLYLEAVTWLSAYLIYSQKNTESAIKAAESWGWESTHQSCLHLAASHSSACTSNLQCTLPIWLGFWFSAVQIWRIPCFCTGNWKLHSSVTLFSYTSGVWPGNPRPCSQPHLHPPQWKSLAPYLCNHLLVTGRNSVLHRSFSQWDSSCSCGYAFTDQSCLLLAPVCAGAIAHAIQCKKSLHLGPGW